ncbi:MAG TPA: CPBP family glutamic-type intramembrane protease [Solirubrobacteraceae bacterium]|nr:CPBP family glutamic-type intramembrane protease [Solirubrobacteraceae bacterium]
MSAATSARPVAPADTRPLLLRSPWLRRGLSAALCLPFVAVLAAEGGTWATVVAALLLADLAVHLLPWSTPRLVRSGRSFWAESTLYLVAPTAAIVLGFALGEPWALTTPDAWWFAVAAPVGALLIWISGMDLPALARGDLAFLYSPSPRSHCAARVTAGTVAPPGEEALFRGLAAAPGLGLGALALSAVAFVARHHVMAGTNSRTTPRALATEIVAATALTALAALSGSILPGLLAHWINNAPIVVLDLQMTFRQEEDVDLDLDR